MTTALVIILSAFLAIAAAAMIIDNRERKARKVECLSEKSQCRMPGKTPEERSSEKIPSPPEDPRQALRVCAVLSLCVGFAFLVVSLDLKNSREGAAEDEGVRTCAVEEGSFGDTLEVAAFKSYGLVYHVRYDAATKTILLSEDYDQLIRLMDAGQLVVVFTGRDGHLAAARRLEDGGAYEIAGERYSPPGNDAKTLYRRWKRAGIRYIEPSVH